jgi:hypothetical protein
VSHVIPICHDANGLHDNIMWNRCSYLWYKVCKINGTKFA